MELYGRDLIKKIQNFQAKMPTQPIRHLIVLHFLMMKFLPKIQNLLR